MAPVTLQISSVGRVVHGGDDGWEATLAQALRSRAPQGAPNIDMALIELWVSGKSRPPAWVVTALPRILTAHRLRVVADLEHLARELGFPPLMDVALAVLVEDASYPKSPSRD